MLLTYIFHYPSKAPRSLICVARSSFIPKSSTQYQSVTQVTDNVHCWGCRQPVPQDGKRSQGTQHDPSCSTAARPCPRPSAPWTELAWPAALPSSRAAPCSSRARRDGWMDAHRPGATGRGARLLARTASQPGHLPSTRLQLSFSWAKQTQATTGIAV